MPTKHVLALIHGITPEAQPHVTEQYRRFLEGVAQSRLPFEQPVCQVSWGVSALGGSTRRPDQYLSDAESFVASLVEKSAVEKLKVPENELGGGLLNRDWGLPGVRQLAQTIREGLVQYGLADALYYAAPEGEKAVRDAVFEQILGALDAEDHGVVHLHLVAHSLGVTVAHDLLYSLFGTHDPYYPREPDSDDSHPLEKATRDRQRRWRAKVAAGELKLGTFISFASQLPLFMMRKQALVELFAKQQRLDPTVIGVDPQREHVQWAIFYDSDEVLGFATRRLYRDTPAIHDIQVNTGVGPLEAHLGYWKSARVIERSLEILRESIARAR